MKLRHPNAVLITIVISQFLCTSLWFAGNGVLTSLARDLDLPLSVLGHLTSAIQLGFISGTLIFAMLRVADRFSPSNVFLFSALAGALANLAIVFPGNTLVTLLLLRFITGFFLAGIYPVGMKIAADYFDKGLGKALGYLVGALVVGTALPHLLRAIGSEVDWKNILIWISLLAATGGMMIGLFVADGPYRRSGAGIDLRESFTAFRIPAFRRAAFGYFGHMWELYALWTFVPVMLLYLNNTHPGWGINVSLLSFFVIGIGGLGCVFNGYLSRTIGAGRAAMIALVTSGLCCLLSPALLHLDARSIVFAIILIWGTAVVADSPMFSTLVAQESPAVSRGTALTIVNCIGFAITIVSIQLLNWLYSVLDLMYLFLFLVPGPVLGLYAMISGRADKSSTHV